MTTIGQVAEWIIANRKQAAFNGYSFEKIVSQLGQCIDDNSMLCVTDESGIVGVICCRNISEKTMFVEDILTTKPGIVKQMLEFFVTHYPGYRLTGKTRTGRHRIFVDAIKLKNKIR